MSAEPFLPPLTPQSTLAALPTWDARLPVTALGDDFDALLRRNPELPGVVVYDAGGVRGAISKSQFQQMISRPFGGEIVRPRAIGFLLGELFDGEVMVLEATLPVQEGLRRALAREKSMLYEPLLVSPDGGKEVKLLGFTDLLRADSRISSLRNQQMQEILATVQEGFLLVERDHRIAGEYSRSVEAIFERSDLAGRSLPEVLHDLLGTEQSDLARDYLDALFNPNVIERLVVDVNPLRSVQSRTADGAARHLRFAFRRSMEGREIRRVLVRLEDRTREVELASELEEQGRQAGRRVDLAMEMMQVEPASLTDYLTRFLAEVGQIERLRSRDTGRPGHAAVDAIFRLLHSLKGEAAVIGLASFAQRLHRTEDVVVLFRDDPGSASPQRLDAAIAALRELGAEAKDLITRLSVLAANRPVEIVPSRRTDVVAELESMIAELSSRLGKPARFIARWSSDDLPAPYAIPIRDVLIQLARNAMVHGVESESERRRLRKSVPAVLQLALRRHEAEGQLEILVQDDGRGLDPARLRERARELGRPADPDDESLLQIIFEPGFSTERTTTADAGRGVGLDLVRERVERLGGMVLVHSQPGVFCAFQIVLPLEAP